MTIDPIAMLKPRRGITGASAILLPFTDDHGTIDWPAFIQHVERTRAAGLIPAVNMDTGFGNLLDTATKIKVLETTRDAMGGGTYYAGAFVGDRPGDPFNADAYKTAVEQIQQHQGTPVIFQSYGLTQQPPEKIIDSYRGIAQLGEFIGFELGTMFAPFGAIYSLDVYRELMKIPQCLGAKHSSLSREQEWQRLQLRDAVRPDFKVFTGNDLAIDMVMYGSDYLLGLSTMAPDLFAKRDAMWANGDPGFYELNDALQYLGFFAFRPAVPAYKHTAAQFLKLRGWLSHDATHPQSPTRPDSDRAILQTMLPRLGL